jgi:capping protein (actin filament) muscle Z-line, alpha
LGKGTGRYLDPRSRRSFVFDHVHQTASDVMPHKLEDDMEKMEKYRAPLDVAFTKYVRTYYRADSSACAVYARRDGEFIMCIESHAYQPRNYW